MRNLRDKARPVADNYFRVLRWLTMAGGIGILVMMLYITSDVFGRYLFLKPLPVSFEIAEMLMIFIVFASLAYVHTRGGHLRLTFLLRRLPPRGQTIADILALVIGIFIFVIIAWQAADWAAYAWRTNEYRLGVIRLPYFPARLTLSIGASILTVAFFVDLIGRIRKLFGTGGRDNVT